MKKFMLLGIFSILSAKVVVIDVKGITCPLCTAAIKHSLKKVKGVKEAKVKLNTHKATIILDNNVSNIKLLEAVKRAGYEGVIKEDK